MPNYEVGLIVHPDLDDAAFNDVVEKVKGWIVDSGGKVSKTDLWGKRKLAYPIQKQSEGQYVFLQATMPGSAVATLERNMRLQEPIMRFLVTLVE